MSIDNCFDMCPLDVGGGIVIYSIAGAYFGFIGYKAYKHRHEIWDGIKELCEQMLEFRHYETWKEMFTNELPQMLNPRHYNYQ